MAFADYRSGRWRDAWKSVKHEDVDTLREVMRDISKSKSPEHICDEAGINNYDLRNFTSPTRKRYPRYLSGLRMLHYAVNWLSQPGTNVQRMSPEVSKRIDRLKQVAKDISDFNPEEDYLFKHLQGIGIISENDCKRICEQLSGEYYSHRLSRNPGYIIKSHYQIAKFDPYDRIPGFVNRLKYGEVNSTAVERTSRGQIFQLNDAYVFLGFVSYGYNSREPRKYDGIQVNIFPYGQFIRKELKTIDGIFLSYVYNGRYEIGPMKLVRSETGFAEAEVGEFLVSEIQQRSPDLDVSSLKLNISDRIDIDVDEYGKVRSELLNSCLSFFLSAQAIFS